MIYSREDLLPLDIGLVWEKDKLVPYVIENNCFHSSGWYQADIKAVMQAIGNLGGNKKGP